MGPVLDRRGDIDEVCTRTQERCCLKPPPIAASDRLQEDKPQGGIANPQGAAGHAHACAAGEVACPPTKHPMGPSEHGKTAPHTCDPQSPAHHPHHRQGYAALGERSRLRGVRRRAGLPSIAG